MAREEYPEIFNPKISTLNAPKPEVTSDGASHLHLKFVVDDKLTKHLTIIAKSPNSSNEPYSVDQNR